MTGTTNTLPPATISARICLLRSAGHTIESAVDAVLGAGTYAVMVEDLYEILRARRGGK